MHARAYMCQEFSIQLTLHMQASVLSWAGGRGDTLLQEPRL
jgi:hypothetical protein